MASNVGRFTLWSVVALVGIVALALLLANR